MSQNKRDLYVSCGTMTQCLSTYLSLSWLKCSMSRSLRLSLRIFFFFSLSVCLLPLRFSVYGRWNETLISGQQPLRFTVTSVNHLPAHQFLHVSSKVEAGEGFLLLGVIFCSLLGLLLLLTSSLILKKHGCQRERGPRLK